MSQRVQKGSTVFRPVARPRARLVPESRQTSALPELPSLPSQSRAQDDLGQRAASAMPPPVSAPHRPPIESPSNASTIAEDYAYIENDPSSSHLHPVASSGSSSHGVPPVVRHTPSRMPPIVNTSQQPLRDALPVAAPLRHPLPQHVSGPVLRLPSPATAPPPVGNTFHDYPLPPSHIPGMSDHLTAIPFPIDPSQIDPQLMGAAGVPLTSPHDIPFHGSGSSFDNRPTMAFDDVSAAKAAQPHRSSQRRSEEEIVDVEQTVADGHILEGTGPGMPSSRRRRSKKPNPILDDEENTDEPPAKKRKVSDTRRSRDRPPSPPSFDPDADPGEELDPTVVTMAALCDDMGRGRVSSRAAQIVSNHAAWRAANREKRARVKAVMEAKKYGRNLEEEEEGANPTAESSQAEDPAAISRTGTPAADSSASNIGNDADGDVGDKAVDGFDYSENLAISRYNVQVRIGANGETIIDEDSLFVNRDEEHRTEGYTHVEESDFTKFVNSATYSRKVRGSRWSAEETELFYDALAQFGENYELISYVLPGRDRKACKNKFKSEDKKNSARITYCLNNRKPYDIATLARMTGKDFTGPTPEIRPPTPSQSTEPKPAPAPSSPPSPRVLRKKSRTPSMRDAGIEIMGDIDEVERDD